MRFHLSIFQTWSLSGSRRCWSLSQLLWGDGGFHAGQYVCPALSLTFTLRDLLKLPFDLWGMFWVCGRKLEKTAVHSTPTGPGGLWTGTPSLWGEAATAPRCSPVIPRQVRLRLELKEGVPSVVCVQVFSIKNAVLFSWFEWEIVLLMSSMTGHVVFLMRSIIRELSYSILELLKSKVGSCFSLVGTAIPPLPEKSRSWHLLKTKSSRDAPSWVPG